MKFTSTAIPDLLLIEPNVHKDGRGFFCESYNHNVFSKNNISDTFVQDNDSLSCQGVLRGLHYQIAPKAQSKLIRVVQGEIFDVAVDIRKDSPTFGKHVSVILSAENKHMLYVPVGFAHGYCALKDGTEVLYKVSDFYSPEHERGILWNDPTLGIEWLKLDVDFIVSEKDKKLSLFKELITR